jgi:Fatty acid cis/trans isomerase (CTI)
MHRTIRSSLIIRLWAAGRRRIFLLFFIVVGGCATVATQVDYGVLYGPSSPKERILTEAEYQARLRRGEVSYPEQVKPILDSRCVVCHGCYDAPCQLKISSFEGLDRGATKRLVYDDSRLTHEQPTRLFIDAHTTEDWRGKEFYPVLNERSDTPQANLGNSVLSLMLALKRNNPLPQSGKLPDSFEFGLDRKLECPTMDEFAGYKLEHPLWGMPYALPGLTEEQEQTITDWLLQGAKTPQHPSPSHQALDSIRKWEQFLNAPSMKQQLVSRYIYEHLFLGHLHFEGHPPNEFYRLVRSYTPSGQPIDEIATVRPYDDPGKAPFYYRIRPIVSTIVDKIHLVYELSDRKIVRYRELFLEPAYEVTELPSYQLELASNPFKVFAALPAKARYQFLLDDAHFFVAGFIKGPVCRGQIALNVIRDQFWIAFFSPHLASIEKNSGFLAANSKYLQLPAASGDDPGLFDFSDYDDLAEEYMKIKEQEIDKLLPPKTGPSLDLIWDGDGDNRNALLTVFRHFDSATVVKGFVGDFPLTGWILDYPVFERIHYLLVAGFNVYGAVTHQLATRLYMDYLRMEAENDLLRFLPADQRATVRGEWYRGIEAKIKNYFDDPLYGQNRPTSVHFRTDDPKKELFELIQARAGKAGGSRDVLNQCEQESCTRPGASPRQQQIEARLQKIARLKGAQLQALPEVAFVRVHSAGSNSDDLAYTLLHNKMLENVAFIVAENLRRDSENDTATLVPGFLGSYPNFFFSVAEEQLPQFVEQLTNAQDDAAIDAFYGTFGIRRSNPEVWEHSDWFNKKYKELAPVEAGWFDLSRYENR